MIAHVAGVPLEETLLPSLSGPSAALLLSILAAEDDADVVNPIAFGRIAGQFTEPRRGRV